MVTKHASPPIALEIGSAKNTPFTPKPIIGSKIVSGNTINAFRSREKNTAFFANPSAWNTDCPANCSDIRKNPKK